MLQACHCFAEQCSYIKVGMRSLQSAAVVPGQVTPAYVTATAALLGVIYPGHNMEKTLRTEHVERMTVQDYIKVMDVICFAPLASRW